jgi:IS5 family transposase
VGAPPWDAVLMFRVLVLQALYTLSDDQTEYQLRDRLSFMRFVGLALHDSVPDVKTIWLYREQWTRTGALARAFDRFDAVLRERGYLAMGGRVGARRNRPVASPSRGPRINGSGLTPACRSRSFD